MPDADDIVLGCRTPALWRAGRMGKGKSWAVYFTLLRRNLIYWGL